MTMLEHAIWWQVYPLGACGAPIREHGETEVTHRLRRLEAWLDYAVELGCSGLLLGPVLASTSHGYDTVDFFRIDPRLGDDDDWDAFVHACHSRGLAVIMDGVFNHVGTAHPLVAADDGMVRAGDDWEGHGDLVPLNHDDHRVADLVVAVMDHWLARGVDAWRLDAAYSVPTTFWAEVLPRVRQRHPSTVFFGEVLHGDFAQTAIDATMDAVTAYELWKATWSSFKDVNCFELAHALTRHGEFSTRVPLQTFVGNHDVERVASLVGDVGAALAAVVLLTVPGVPSIYYGDEQAFRGRKLTSWSADDEIRPSLPESPDALAPDGWWLYRLYQELIALRRRNPWLWRGRLEVVENTNATIHYAIQADGHRSDIWLDLEHAPHARVEIDGETTLTWS